MDVVARRSARAPKLVPITISLLKRGTRASFAFASLHKQALGDGRRILRALVTEVSILSPSRKPVEPLARVAWIGERSSPVASSDRQAVSEVVLPASGVLVRRNVGVVLEVR